MSSHLTHEQQVQFIYLIYYMVYTHVNLYTVNAQNQTKNWRINKKLKNKIFIAPLLSRSSYSWICCELSVLAVVALRFLLIMSFFSYCSVVSKDF